MTAPRHPDRPEGHTPPAQTWQGLSQEAQAALLRRRVSVGPAGQLLEDAAPIRPEELADPVMQWARTELEGGEGDKGVFVRWEKYADLLDDDVPASVDDMLEQGPGLANTLQRLFKAKQALTDSRELTPSDINIGETMHLTLVPWQTFESLFREGQQGSLNTLERWVNTCLQRRQGISNGFQISDRRLTDSDVPFAKAFFEDAAMYRDVAQPSKLLRVSEYLTAKIARDGAWGLILTQRGQSDGYYGYDASNRPQFAGDWTNNGKAHYRIAGYDVDAMGVYEYIAHVLQEDQLDQNMSILLLANRLNGYQGRNLASVPHAKYSGGEKIHLLLREADGEELDSRFADPGRILLTVGAEHD